MSSFNKNKIISHKIARKSANSLWFFEQKSIYKDLFSQHMLKAISQEQLSKITEEVINNFRKNLLEKNIAHYDDKLMIYNKIFSKFKNRKISELVQDSTFNGASWKSKVLSLLFEIEKDYILRMDSERFISFLLIKEGLLQIEEGYGLYKNFVKTKDVIIKKSAKILSPEKSQKIKQNLELVDNKIKTLSPIYLADMSDNLSVKSILNIISSNSNLEKFILSH